ncbi:MAG: type II secretion system F family protein [Synergistales bacterium]|nr:type II secretion system F family protein [Synergistales bacterium]
MPQFTYQAYDRDGKVRKGNCEASSSAVAIEQIQAQGLVVVEVRQTVNTERKKGWEKELSLESQSLFCRSLASYLKSGLPLADALRLLSRQSAGKRLSEVYTFLLEEVQGGKKLSKAIDDLGIFRDSLMRVVESGEQSGNLVDVLEQLSEQFRVELRLRRKVRSALTYPMVMMVIGAAVVTFLLGFVVPRLASLFEELGQSLPFLTRMLIFVSGIVKVMVLPLICLLLLFLFLQRRKKQKKGLFFRNIRKMINLSVLSSQIATLLESGIPLVQALKMSSSLDTEPQKWRDVADLVKKGYRFDQALVKEGSFPEDMIYIVRVGEMGGNLPDSLRRLSENYWEISESRMERLANLVEPVMVLVLGLVVGFVVMAILLPIFEISSLVR